MSVVDDRIFGDLKSFKEQFANLHNKPTFDILKARLHHSASGHCAVAALTLEEKLAGQKQIKALEAERANGVGLCLAPKMKSTGVANS